MPIADTSRPVMELTFEGCVQDAEEYGSGSDQMVSRLFFWIKIEGSAPEDYRRDLERISGKCFASIRIEPPAGYTGPMLSADVRQPVGEDFATGRIDVILPEGSGHRLDSPGFRREAIAYFRTVASESGAMVRVEEGRPVRGGFRETAHVRLRNNVEASRHTVRLEATPLASRA